MGTDAEKLAYLNETKEQIKNAITEHTYGKSTSVVIEAGAYAEYSFIWKYEELKYLLFSSNDEAPTEGEYICSIQYYIQDIDYTKEFGRLRTCDWIDVALDLRNWADNDLPYLSEGDTVTLSINNYLDKPITVYIEETRIRNNIEKSDTFRSYTGKIKEMSDISPIWTDWRYFSLDNNRNDLVAKLKYSDTSNGKDFSYMLRGCDGLWHAPDIDTSNGENFSGMFYANHSLRESPVLDTSNGRDFSYMHNCCCSMEDFPNYNLEKAENLAYMYWNCQKMTHSVGGRIHLCLPSAKNMQGMFRNSYKITSVFISELDPSILENTEGIFNSCSGLLDAEGIVTGKSGAAKMFRGCEKLQSVNLEINSKIPSPATNVWKETFEWCYELTDLKMSRSFTFNKWSGLNLKYSTKLTRASIENVVEKLSEVPYAMNGRAYITLSKTAVDNAFETSEGAADGSTSAEWLELIAPKIRWTISLC